MQADSNAVQRISKYELGAQQTSTTALYICLQATETPKLSTSQFKSLGENGSGNAIMAEVKTGTVLMLQGFIFSDALHQPAEINIGSSQYKRGQPRSQGQST